MATYGLDIYGTQPGGNVYGLALPPNYLVDPFVAQSLDYGRILVTWNKPSAPAGAPIFQYRLLSNRYGFPVNENDGNILLDSGTPAPGATTWPYPGSQYIDQAVIPGTYHYYGMYLLVDIADNIWIRAGATCCLATSNFGSAQMMWSLIPEHFRTLLDGSEITTDAAGNVYLQQFLNVLGWGMDYLHTQYFAAANYLNDPLSMPIDDLYNMAEELGLNFSPEVPAYTMRKAVANAAHVFRERGTLTGLRNEVVLRTSWDADVQIGNNFLLNDDQSQFLNNIKLYEPNSYYQVNDIVLVYWDSANNVLIQPDPGRTPWVLDGYYNTPITPATPNPCVITGYCYKSTASNNQFNFTPGSIPTSTWSLVTDLDDVWHHMDNPVTGNPNTWEVVDSTAANGIPTVGSATIGTGVQHPLAVNTPASSFRTKNLGGSTRNLFARSVSRRNIDLGNIPDNGFELGFTLPGRHHQNPTWAPGNWPQVFWSPDDQWWPFSWWNGPYHTPSYWTLTDCTMVQSAAESYNGTHSALISPMGFLGLATSLPAGQIASASSPWVECAGSISVTGNVWARPNGTLSTTMYVSLQWFDQWGSLISTYNGTAETPASGTFSNTLTVTATSPISTCYVALLISYTAAEPTDLVYVDSVKLSVTTALPAGFGNPVEPTQAIQDGLPVPWVRPSQEWSPGTRYGTDDICLYQNQVFIALRASTGATPPTNNTPTPEWAPLSESDRIRIAVSGYNSQDMTNSATQTVAVVPFVEWFDRHGNWIAREFARVPSGTASGTVAKPDQLAFDSFTSLSIIADIAGEPTGTITLGPWQGKYYTNTVLSGRPAYTDTEATIGTWTSGASPGPGIPTSGWSASWSCSFTPPVTGNYTFAIQCAAADSHGKATGGCRVIVNGVTIINNWRNPTTALLTTVPPIALAGATSASIVVQYYNDLVPTVSHSIGVPSFLPHIVTGLRATSWTNTTVTIAWDAMTESTQYAIRVTYMAPDGGRAEFLKQQDYVDGDTFTYVVRNLVNYQTYGLHVASGSDVEWTPEASIHQRTADW